MLDGYTAETLARFQFAFTVSFHIIFPAFSIGLASYLAVLNALWLRTRETYYLSLFNYWKKIFAVAFGMGVVSGIVMSYQFGTNWSVFSDRTGPILGPLMAYEILSAFFLEAGFLGIMLFGRRRVGDKLHMFATAMVAFGTLMSATWILSVNSWMQTPVGYSINEFGQFVPEDWWAIVFNPSFPYRLVHMVLAAYLTTALVVGGAAGYQMWRGQRGQPTKTMFSMAMWMLVIVTPLQIFAGDLHGLNTYEHQPQKVMAMEGHFDSYPDGAPLILFGIPNAEEKRIDYAIEIPKFSSLILKHDLNAPLKGLDTIPDEDEPPVAIVFFSFRVMIGLGFAMLGLGLWSLYARFRGTLYDSKMLHLASMAMGPMGFVAVLAGWITTEVGRQPFTVYGLMRTSESLAPVAAPAVAASLIAFIIVYFFVFGAGTFYILRMLGIAPEDQDQIDLRKGPIRTATPKPSNALAPENRTMFGLELSFIWAGIIAFAVLVYVILDGFDLGVGILFPLSESEKERDVMMNSIAPIWDGNETWLVLGGGGLFAVFPLAYAVIMPALYMPIILMLLALIFRGVAFEYRWRTKRWKRVWDVAFTGGSVTAAMMQGIALGALVQGIEVEDRAYAGGWWDWLTPFTVMTGIAVTFGYALLGATWLNMKLEGRVQAHMQHVAWPFALATVGFMGIVSLATPFLDPVYFERWFAWPFIAFSAIVPLLLVLCIWRLFAGLKAGNDTEPFIAAVGMFVLGFIGVGISFYPNIVPPSLSIAEAAAPDSSLKFALVGTIVLIPMILAYTAYSYWVFRGKIDPEEGYH